MDSQNLAKSLFSQLGRQSQDNFDKKTDDDLRFFKGRSLVEQEINNNLGNEIQTQFIFSATNDPKQLIRFYLRSDYRTDEEAAKLLEYLKTYKLFRQFVNNWDDKDELEPLIMVCKKLKLEKKPEGRIIVKQGEISDGRVYMVLTGELSVYVKDTHFVGDGVNVKIVREEPSKNDISMSFSSVMEEALNSHRSTVKSGNTPRSSRNSRRGSFSLKQMKLTSNNFLSPSDASSRKPSQFRPEPTTPSKFKTNIPSSLIVTRSPTKDSLQLELPSDSENNSPSSSTKNRSPVPVSPPSNLHQFIPSNSLFGGSGGTNNQFVLKETAHGVLKDKITEGGYFGEKAPYGYRRKATIVANTDVELLIMSGDDYRYIQNKYDKTKIEYINYVKKAFDLPEEQNAQLLDAITYIMELKEIKFDETVLTQGQKGEEFFLIYEGSCELRKSIVYDKSQTLNFESSNLANLYRMKKTTKEEVVSNIEKGSFFGLEVLAGLQNYEYTVRVTSPRLKVISFNSGKVQVRFPTKSIQALKKLYSEQKAEHSQNLQRRIEKTKGSKADLKQIGEINPTVMLPKRKPIILSKNSQPTTPISPKIDLNQVKDFDGDYLMSQPGSTKHSLIRQSYAFNQFPSITTPVKADPIKIEAAISPIHHRKSGSMPHIDFGASSPSEMFMTPSRDFYSPSPILTKEDFSRFGWGLKDSTPEPNVETPKMNSTVKDPKPFTTPNMKKKPNKTKFEETISLRQANYMTASYQDFLDKAKARFKFLNDEEGKPSQLADIKKYKIDLEYEKYFKHKPRGHVSTVDKSKRHEEINHLSQPSSPTGKEINLAQCLDLKIKKMKPKNRFGSADLNIRALPSVATFVTTAPTKETSAETTEGYEQTGATLSSLTSLKSKAYFGAKIINHVNSGKTHKKIASLSTIYPTFYNQEDKKGENFLQTTNRTLRATTSYQLHKLKNLVVKAQKIV